MADVVCEQNCSVITAGSTLTSRGAIAWVIEDSLCMDELYAPRFIDTIASRPTHTSAVRNRKKSARFSEPVGPGECAFDTLRGYYDEHSPKDDARAAQSPALMRCNLPGKTHAELCGNCVASLEIGNPYGARREPSGDDHFDRTVVADSF